MQGSGCFLLPGLSSSHNPLCSCNILLSRCQLPPLAASVFICASVFFMVSPFCLLHRVCFSFSLFFFFLLILVSAPHVLSTRFKVHKQPQFGHLISTPSNYYLSCNNLGLFMSSFYPTPPLETGASLSPYNVVPPTPSHPLDWERRCRLSGLMLPLSKALCDHLVMSQGERKSC